MKNQNISYDIRADTAILAPAPVVSGGGKAMRAPVEVEVLSRALPKRIRHLL